MRVVLDTNVMVSAILGGTTGKILDFWLAERFELIVSDAVLKEYRDVLTRPKFAFDKDTINEIVYYIFTKAAFVTVNQAVHMISRDYADNRFLEAAIAGKADCIVSGDRHLLDLGQYRSIPIIKPNEFLRRLSGC